jgi:hypothetical protein
LLFTLEHPSVALCPSLDVHQGREGVGVLPVPEEPNGLVDLAARFQEAGFRWRFVGRPGNNFRSRKEGFGFDGVTAESPGAGGVHENAPANGVRARSGLHRLAPEGSECAGLRYLWKAGATFGECKSPSKVAINGLRLPSHDKGGF